MSIAALLSHMIISDDIVILDYGNILKIQRHNFSIKFEYNFGIKRNKSYMVLDIPKIVMPFQYV